MLISDNHSVRSKRFDDDRYENSSIRSIRSRASSSNFSLDIPKIGGNKYKHVIKQAQLRRQSDIKQKTLINLLNTKYPVLSAVSSSENLDWKIEIAKDSRTWTIKWCDSAVTADTLMRMNVFQRINHFPGMSTIARKNGLAANLARMKEKFQREYDFYPRTFLYPADAAKLRSYYQQSRKRGLLKTLIVKPEAGCQGRGIYLTQNLQDIEKEQKCVVQKYISNPLLYEGLKFDLRIYVLLASCEPLRIYIYNEGLVRLSTEKYRFPDISNLHNMYMHLTNYAINKDSPKYEFNNSMYDLSHGHKKSIAEFFKILKDIGYRANLYWSQIKDIIIKTLIAGQPHLSYSYKVSRPNDFVNDMCFQVLGFDFMIDNSDKCFLLQVNHTPSFTTDTPLDQLVKSNLIKDTLLMMQCTTQQTRLKQDLEIIHQREKLLKLKDVAELLAEKKNTIKKLMDIRIEHQLQCLGTYQPIYPSKNESRQEKYEDLLAFAQKDFLQVTLSESRLKIFNKHNSKPLDTRSSKGIDTKPSKPLDLRSVKQSAGTPKIRITERPSLRRMITQAPEQKKQTIVSNYMMKNSLPPSKKSTKLNPTPIARTEMINDNTKKSKGSLDRYSYAGNREAAKSVKEMQLEKNIRDLSSFRKRIRSYKTPF